MINQNEVNVSMPLTIVHLRERNEKPSYAKQ